MTHPTGAPVAKPFSEFGEGYTDYPPSILLVGSQTTRLKKWLEKKGCHTIQAEACSETMTTRVKGDYFDLIVLACRSAVHNRELAEKIKTDPEMMSIPVVILNNDSGVQWSAEKLSTPPVYYLAPDTSVRNRLLELIEQIHYLSYRYM